MKTEFTRQRKHLMSQYGSNALIQLIAASGVGFILAYALYVILLVVTPDQEIMVGQTLQKITFGNMISPYIALQPFEAFWQRPWVLLTYVWAHATFWNLLSNMLWLYCFGSVLQSLIGYREILPLFLFASWISGALYVVATALFPSMRGSDLVIGALPGVMAFAIAAITLAPGFKFYLGDRFSIPLWLVLAVFLVLNGMNLFPGNARLGVLCVFSALIGFGYIKLLHSGYKPGAWLYGLGDKVQGVFTPAEHLPARNQPRRTQTLKHIPGGEKKKTADLSVDALLDKINLKGYNSLTEEEKEILLKASKEK